MRGQRIGDSRCDGCRNGDLQGRRQVSFRRSRFMSNDAGTYFPEVGDRVVEDVREAARVVASASQRFGHAPRHPPLPSTADTRRKSFDTTYSPKFMPK